MKRDAEQSFPEYITTGVIAQYCGVSRVTVIRWIQKQHLPAFRLPSGQYRVRREDFDAFLVKHGIPVRKLMLKKIREGRVYE